MKSSKCNVAGNARNSRLACALLIGTTLLASACVTMTEDQLQARADRHAYFELQFTEYRRQCHAGGKRIVIDAKQKIGRNGLPSFGDRYFCVQNSWTME
jgi:hypothetical protein